MIKRIKENLREVVYGGMDGAVTTFAVVTGAAGANLDVRVILILGFANVLADGFSMAVGSYLSERSDQELSELEGKTKKQELKAPLQASVATFLAFVLIGIVPLLAYLIDYIFGLEMENNDMLLYAVAFTMATFVGIGLLRAHATKTRKSKAVFESLGLGLAAALISYAAGSLLEKIIK